MQHLTHKSTMQGWTAIAWGCVGTWPSVVTPGGRFAVHPTFGTPLPWSWLCKSYIQHHAVVQLVQHGSANGHLAAVRAQRRWVIHTHSNLCPGAITAAHSPYLKVCHVQIPPAPIILTIYRCPYTFLIKTLLHIHNHILNDQEQ